MHQYLCIIFLAHKGKNINDCDDGCDDEIIRYLYPLFIVIIVMVVTSHPYFPFVSIVIIAHKRYLPVIYLLYYSMGDGTVKKVVDHLRRLREESGLSQSEFAGKMGVNRMTINNYETGKRIPDIDFAVRAADFFDVTVEYICGRTEYRDKDDIQVSVAKAESLVKAIEAMPQSEVQETLSQLVRVLEKANENGIGYETLIAMNNIFEQLGLLLAGYKGLKVDLEQSIFELQRYKVPDALIHDVCLGKTATIAEYALSANASIAKTLDVVCSMLQKNLKTCAKKQLKI